MWFRWLPNRPHDLGFGLLASSSLSTADWHRRRAVIGALAFGIPRAEASRGDGSDGPYARLPADILSSTVQLVALSQVPGQAHFSDSLNSGSECAFRAVAPHWPRGGQSSDQDVTLTVSLDLDSSSCREVMPREGTSPRATGLRGSCSSWLSSSRSTGQDPSPRDRTQMSTSWRRPEPCYFSGGSNKAKMTWSPPPLFRCRLVRGFEGFGQVLLLVGEQMAVSVDGDLDA
jgi:hypothetical protein